MGQSMASLKITSNMNGKMELKEESIIIAEGKLTVMDQSTTVMAIKTNGIDRAFVEEGIGVCKLVVRMKDKKEIEVAYFTKAKVKSFKKFGDALNQYVKKNKLVNTTFEEKQIKQGGIGTLYWLYGFASKYKGLLAWGVILSIITVGLNLVPPYMLKVLIDNVILSPTHSQALFFELTLILLASYAALTVVSTIQSYILTKTGNKIVTELRSRLFKHAVMLSATDVDNVTPSRIQTRLISDAGNTQWLMTAGLSTIITNVLTIVGIGVILFLLFPSLALYVLIPIPFIILIIIDYNSKSDVMYYKSWRRSADLATKISDVIPNYTIVKSAHKENFEGDEFDSGLTQFYDTQIDISKMELKHWEPVGFLISISTIIIWWVGGSYVIAGTLQLGVVTAFLAYMGMFYGPVQQISTWLPYIQESITSGERLREVFDSKDAGKEPKGKNTPDIDRDIRFQNLWFGYDPLFPVLKGVNATIKRGRITSIVGKSGAGKSTIAKLLLGLYSIDEGSIKFGNASINDIDIGYLRNKIAYVPQDSVFFDSTIAYNLTYFSSGDIDPLKLIAATKVVEMHEEVMKFALRYDNRIRSRGMSLSGGQRQRLAVARAILGNPEIVVLDEITANLDAINARKVNDSVLKLESDKTMVFVTHDLNEVLNSDSVIVLDEGKVAEQGRPEDLIRKRGRLYNMFKYKLVKRSKRNRYKEKKSLESFVEGYVADPAKLAIVAGERRSFVDITYKGKHTGHVMPKKPFPISHPSFVILGGRAGKELMAIADYKALDANSRSALEASLEANNFNPTVKSIKSVKITGDGLAWELVTDRGQIKFVTRNRSDVMTAKDYVILIDEFNTPLKIEMKDLDKRSRDILNMSV